MSTPPSMMVAFREAMRHLGDRQRVIAQNIANADTPGFKARELRAPSFAALVEKNGAGTDIPHPAVEISDDMRRLGTKTPSLNTITDPDISEVKPDGNTVTLEEQLLKMGQIQADYVALTNLYAKQRTLLKTALGKGGGTA